MLPDDAVIADEKDQKKPWVTVSPETVGPNPQVEGVYYLLSNALGKKERLDLEDGNWKVGELEVWEPNDTDGTNGNRNQRWLITRVPGDDGDGYYYHITNLFYGCLVGIFPGQQRSGRGKKIQAGPSTTAEQSTQWGLWYMGHGTYTIYWRKNNNLRMALDHGYHHGLVLAYHKQESDNQMWIHVRNDSLDPPDKTTARWMSFVPPSTKLSMLSIVGTHQSLALHGIRSQGHQGSEGPAFPNLIPFDNPRCQNKSPYEQMLDGVRYLDCRFYPWTANDGWATSLYAFHGSTYIFGADEGYSFCALLQCVKLFLSRFPNETLIIDVNSAMGPVKGWERAFLNDFKPFSYLFKKNNTNKVFHQLTLGDVKGKAILVSRFNFTHPHECVFREDRFWAGNGGKYIQHEEPDDLSFFSWSDKVRICRQAKAAAVSDWNDTHTHSTGWNMSSAVCYNPTNFFAYAAPHINIIYRQDSIGVGGQHRVGIVKFDFYESLPDAVLSIIRANPGCGNLTRN